MKPFARLFAVLATCAAFALQLEAASTNATVVPCPEQTGPAVGFVLFSDGTSSFPVSSDKNIPPYVWFKTNIDPRRWIASPIPHRRGAATEQYEFLSSCFVALKLLVFALRVLLSAATLFSLGGRLCRWMVVFVVRPSVRSKLDHAVPILCVPARRQRKLLLLVVLLATDVWAMDVTTLGSDVEFDHAASGAVAAASIISAVSTKRPRSTSTEDPVNISVNGRKFMEALAAAVREVHGGGIDANIPVKLANMNHGLADSSLQHLFSPTRNESLSRQNLVQKPTPGFVHLTEKGVEWVNAHSSGACTTPSIIMGVVTAAADETGAAGDGENNTEV